MDDEVEVTAIRAMLAARPRPPSVAERRVRLDGLGEAFPTASDVERRPETVGALAAEWTQTPAADAGRVIYYLHGGAYAIGSIASHRSMVAEAGRAAAARTFALAYRLAPENPYPAAIEDALAGYRFLLDSGVAANRIALSGDSAGGGLTLATMISLRDAGLPLPGCAWCISPWVDLEGIGESITTKAKLDPMLDHPYLVEAASMYLGGADPRSPLAAPLYADLRELPPTLIQVGTAEILLDDSTRLAARLGQADVRTTLEIWPRMMHVWHLFHQLLGDGRRALASAGAYIRAHTG